MGRPCPRRRPRPPRYLSAGRRCVRPHQSRAQGLKQSCSFRRQGLGPWRGPCAAPWRTHCGPRSGLRSGSAPSLGCQSPKAEEVDHGSGREPWDSWPPQDKAPGPQPALQRAIRHAPRLPGRACSWCRPPWPQLPAMLPVPRWQPHVGASISGRWQAPHALSTRDGATITYLLPWWVVRGGVGKRTIPCHRRSVILQTRFSPQLVNGG